MTKTYVYDYETIQNCFVAIYVNNKDPKEIIIFEVSDYENQFSQYLDFLEGLMKGDYIVSFNGLNFDSQVAMFCWNTMHSLIHMTGGEIARAIFHFVQKLIELKNEKGYTPYRINELPFKEIDLAAINNYNNKQKFASLKWL